MKHKWFQVDNISRVLKRNNNFRVLFVSFFLTIFYGFLYKLFMPRVNAFGCFDDCAAIVPGYFITQGKVLYSQIFLNHQLLMPYISGALQSLFQPTHMFELIQLHRQFVLIFGFVFSFLLVFRFGYILLFALVVYELSKFYIFGNRFLAEALIVYPLLYMCGLVWFRLNKKKLYFFDYILVPLFTWFVIFIREPYVPLAIVLFGLLVFGKSFAKEKKFALVVFLTLSLLTFALVPLDEYFFNIYTVNKQTVFASESQTANLFGLGSMQVFFYPIALFFYGEWNLFRILLVGFSFVFLSSISIFIKERKFRMVGVILLILGLANLRFVEPGHIFYSAFHMITWYALFIALSLFMLWDITKTRKKIAIVLSSVVLGVFVLFLFSPKSYVFEKISTHEEFITNFGKELQIGSVIQAISSPSDTLFLDGTDDLIYWQARLMPSYRYSWYTSFMPYIPKYKNERLAMFAKNPPDIYYGSCPKEKNLDRIMPKSAKSMYVNIPSDGKPSCLYVKKTLLLTITKEQWERAKEFHYFPPEDASGTKKMQLQSTRQQDLLKRMRQYGVF